MPSFLLRNLLRFVRILTTAGLDVHAGAAAEAARALTHVDLGRRDDVRLTLRAVLIHRRDDLELFDRAFDVFFRRRRPGETLRDLRAMGEKRRFRPSEVAGEDKEMARPGGGGASTTVAPTGATPRASYSAREVLGRKDFAAFTREEMMAARAFLQRLRWEPDARATRRWARAPTGRLDLARLFRRSLQHGGEPIDLPRRSRKEETRPLVLLCDVSGSMEPYSRMLLHFVHAVASSRPRVEVFLFATRLVRITRYAARRRSHSLTGSLASLAPDWAGGTRIGDALRAFNLHWVRRVMRHGPVVMIVSDGWDRGDPLVLDAEIARLERSCHRLIWLNPLLGDPEYQPLTRGMQAALPHVDDFLPVHNLDSLSALADHLNALPPRRGPARRGGGRSAIRHAEASGGDQWT